MEAFDVLFCPGKPAVNYLFFGDSFNALVKDGSKTDVGTIIKENKRTLFGHKHEVWSEMTWGKGLSESLDVAERAMLKLAERPEPRPYVIVISWSGNDVVGRNGCIDNPAALAGWATDSEAKRKAAMDIIERNAKAVMMVRDRLRHIAFRSDVIQVALIVPRDFGTYPSDLEFRTEDFLSKKISYLVRGHAREHATRSIPEINLKDNSFDYAAVAKWIQRRYDWNCSQYTLLQAAGASTRFEVYVEYAPAGQLWNGLSFMPLRIRAFTGHNDWVTEASGLDNIGEPITMDVNYTIKHAKKGVRPGFERRCPKSRDTHAARRTSLTSSTWAFALVAWVTGSPLAATPT